MHVRALLCVAFISGVVTALPTSPASPELLPERENFPTLRRITWGNAESLGRQTKEEKKFDADYLDAFTRFDLLEDMSKFSPTPSKADSPGERAFLTELLQAYSRVQQDWEGAVLATVWQDWKGAVPDTTPAGTETEQTAEHIAGCFFCSFFTLGIASPLCC